MRRKRAEGDRRYFSTPVQQMLSQAKIRAKRDGREFNIDKTDVVIPTHCPVLGIELHHGKRAACDHSPTLDRRDTTKGYVKGNVFVISHRANKLKSNMTLEEIEALASYMRTGVSVTPRIPHIIEARLEELRRDIEKLRVYP